MTTSAPITLRIYQSEKAVSDLLVGKTALGLIVAEAMLNFYSVPELKKMQRGQMAKYESIINKLMASVGSCIERIDGLYNYFAFNGKSSDRTEHVHVVSDEDADMVRELAALEIANAA